MKFRLIPALLILLVIVVTVRLGFWQRDRAHQKEALEAHITQFENAPAQPVGGAPVDLKDIEFHRVKARGSFVADKVVYLDNRPYNDQPGFYVVMPFKLADGGYVLVNRGWLPRNMSNRETIAPYTTPQGEIEIEGIARADASRAFELGQGGSAAHQTDPPESGYRCLRRGNRAAAAAVRDPAIERRRRQARARLAGADERRRTQLRLHVPVVGHGGGGAGFRPICRAPRREERARTERVMHRVRLAEPEQGLAPRNH